MPTLSELATAHSLALVEDNAHGLLGRRYKGKNLGTFGMLATQSFDENENFTCGEGGALIINDTRLIERAEVIREKGTDRSRFFRGQVDKYTWVDIGSSYVLSELNAAFLWAQFEQRESIQARRQKVWDRYYDSLEPLCRLRHWRVPVVPAGCEQAYHMFYLILRTPAERQALIAQLAERGVLAVFHYVPLHLSPMGRRFGGRAGDCPVTEDMSDRLLRLPFYTGMTEGEQRQVLTAIQQFGEKGEGVYSAG